jgi:hypothetical protein
MYKKSNEQRRELYALGASSLKFAAQRCLSVHGKQNDVGGHHAEGGARGMGTKEGDVT